MHFFNSNPEYEAPKLLLADSWPLNSPKPTFLGKLICVGTIIEVCFENDNMLKFKLADSSRKVVVDLYKSNYSSKLCFKKGDIVEIKGVYIHKEKFNEWKLKIFDIRHITIDEEFMHYLKVINSSNSVKNSIKDNGQILNQEKENMIQNYKSVVQEEKQEPMSRERLYKAIFSIIFFYWADNPELMGQEDYKVELSEFMKKGSLEKLKNYVNDDEHFGQMAGIVLHNMLVANLIFHEESWIFLNTEFFNNFEQMLVENLRKNAA